LNFLSELDLISGVLNGDDPVAPTLSLRIKGFSNLGAYNSPAIFVSAADRTTAPTFSI
jgi:hypothetical protein